MSAVRSKSLTVDRLGVAFSLVGPALDYQIDLFQRTILFWDVMRQRGNGYREHLAKTVPHVLRYKVELVADGRTLERPVNYGLVRIVPPAGVTIDPKLRPFVIVDPRAGHGPGIGGFKADSEIGVALRAGHTCYFVGFLPDPMPGQTIEDIARAEATFLKKVIELHPDADGKPCVVGNCQAGWAVMMLASIAPELFGPIIIAGSPLSYWTGQRGPNPMRCNGGLLGGSWLTALTSDIGNGIFDGAWLVQNFENLNPANTFWKKPYNLFSKIDTEAANYLEFERWWGGHVNLTAKEMQSIADELFVGNKRAAGLVVGLAPHKTSGESSMAKNEDVSGDLTRTGEAHVPHAKYEKLIASAKQVQRVVTIVAHPCDETSLRGATEAAEAGIIVPVLVGPAEKIRSVAQSFGLDISRFEIIDAPHSHAAAEKAVLLIREGKGALLMKGSLHTDELLQCVTSSATGLRTERRLSHVFIMDVPTYPETLFITDAAINIFPDLQAKRDIVQNAIDLFTQVGLGTPRVALLSAVETVTTKIPSTIDAAALCKMADRGQITGGILDGPLAFDNAIDPEAARIKGIRSEVAGRAQILVVPDLEAGNMLAKNLTFLAKADAAGIVLGARVPIILTSRANSVRTRMASCAAAVLYAHACARMAAIAAA